jgi:hypothetical protein
MTQYQQPSLGNVARRLHPSPGSIADAVHDPGLLLQLQATQPGRAVSAPMRRRRHGSDVERHGSSLAVASPGPVW